MIRLDVARVSPEPPPPLPPTAPPIPGGPPSADAGAPNLQHAIHDGLVYFVGSHPDGSQSLGRELISGTSLSTMGGAAFTGDHPTEGGWKCLLNPNTSTAGAWSQLTSGMTSLGNVYTVWADVIFAGVAEWSKIISVPWTSSASWDSPFTPFAFERLTTTTQANHHFIPAGTSTTSTHAGASGSFPTALQRKRLWMIRNGSSLKFGVNGVQVGSDISMGTSAAPNWAGTTSNAVTIGNRSPFSPSSGLQGRFLRLMVWNRALTTGEMSNLNSDPMLGLLEGEGPPPPPPPSSDARAHWPMDTITSNTTPDIGVSGRTGTLHNSPTLVAGQKGNAIQFLSGSQQRMTFSSGVFASEPDAITVAAWIFPLTYGVTTGGNVISWWQSTWACNFQLRLMTNQQGLRGFVQPSPHGSSSAEAERHNVISLNTWTHVAMTYNRNGDRLVRLFVNGTEGNYQIHRAGSMGQLMLASRPGFVASEDTSAPRYFNGRIDDVRVYDFAMTASQIQAIM